MPTDRINLLLNYLEEDPNDRFSRYALGLEYVKMNELAKARECYEELLERAPDYLPVYYQAGKLFEAQSQPEAAIAVYRKGIAVATDQGDAHTRSELQGALFQLVDPDEA
jgi:tetratricopeptide (TPR) repeat protein